ncbi:MAG TPA: hypothetical protein PLS75_08980 [Candidatus Marinimicrobia bacterium]|nr:hypothetical protein [Candidatus Neomarinimicrobiota bacterium]
MKKLVLSAVVVMFLMASLSYGFGLGIMLGEPSGLSGKYWMSEKNAIAGGLAWSLSHDYMHVHADYLIHNNNLINVSGTTLPFYYGLGAGIGLGDDFHLGARIPVGIEYFFADRKFDVFFELVPVVGLLPDFGFGVSGAIGLRYNF